MVNYESTLNVLNSAVIQKNLIIARREIDRLPQYTNLLVELTAIPCANEISKRRDHYGLLRNPTPDSNHTDIIRYKMVDANFEVMKYFKMLEHLKESTVFRGILFQYKDTGNIQFTPYLVESKGFTFFSPTKKTMTYLAEKFPVIKGSTGTIDLEGLVDFDNGMETY